MLIKQFNGHVQKIEPLQVSVDSSTGITYTLPQFTEAIQVNTDQPLLLEISSIDTNVIKPTAGSFRIKDSTPPTIIPIDGERISTIRLLAVSTTATVSIVILK